MAGYANNSVRDTGKWRIECYISIEMVMWWYGLANYRRFHRKKKEIRRRKKETGRNRKRNENFTVTASSLSQK